MQAKVMRMILCTAMVAGAAINTAHAQKTDPQLATDIDKFVQHLVTLTGIPGVAIAVVQGDAPVLIKGYGFADIERRIPVTDKTEFYLGSLSKAFTALTVRMMAERGVVDMDAPIDKYLPNVTWGHGVRADSITLRRLLSHSHGIDGNGPVIWRTAFTGEQSPALMKNMLRHHGLSGAGRNYKYTNLGYNIAGLIIEDVARQPWQEAVERYVLKPLGMKHTTSYISRLDSAQLGMPYRLTAAGPERVPYSKSDANMQAAGGHVSTAADMAKWLEVQLNQGKLDGKQIFPAHVIAETQRQHVATTAERRVDMHQIGYGLGWSLATLNADTILQHSGGFATFRATMGLNPKHRIGVAVLTAEKVMGGGMIEVITQYVLDRAADPATAQQRYEVRLQQIPAIVAREKSRMTEGQAARAARPQVLSKPLTAYTGRFENPESGSMTWTIENDRLTVVMGALKSVAEVFNADKQELRVEPEPGSGEVVQFRFAGDQATSVFYRNREFTRK